MTPPFSAVLLAGGKSSRMGRDKALIEIEGRPLWRRQISLLEELGPREIFLSGPERSQEYTSIADEIDNAGPLAGLVASLRHCSTPLLIVLAVDLPLMTSDYLRGLLAHSSSECGVVPSQDDRFQPLAAVYPRASLAQAEAGLRADDRSSQSFCRRCLEVGLVRQHAIADQDRTLFTNVNTPHDLRLVDQVTDHFRRS